MAIPAYPREEYEAALSSELEDRAHVFLELPETICGIECVPLTPRRVEWLRLAKSPFIVGGKAGPIEVAQFLWIVSKQFTPNKAERDKFIPSILGIDVQKAREEIDEYLERAYLNAMSAGNQRPCISPCASYAFALAGEPYRMPWREVLDTPLGVIFQLIGALEMSQGKPMINKRSDAVNVRYAEALNAAQKAETEKPKRKKKGKKSNGKG